MPGKLGRIDSTWPLAVLELSGVELVLRLRELHRHDRHPSRRSAALLLLRRRRRPKPRARHARDCRVSGRFDGPTRLETTQPITRS